MEDGEVIGWYFDGYQHWTELFARRGYNWKNFTFAALEVEYADHLRRPGYIEIHAGLMGFGFRLMRFPPGPKTAGMEGR